MEITSTYSNEEIEKRISQKIETVKSYENDIPGILILINIRLMSVVYMSERGRKILNVTLEELHQMGKSYFHRFFNETEANEYIPYLTDVLHAQQEDGIVSFFQQVRPSPDHPWIWFLNGVKIIMKDANGLPLLAMVTAIPIDQSQNIAVNVQRLLDEKNFLKQNNHLLDALTKRETEVLKLVAIGCSNEEISTQLFLSKETVATHRKNIKRKLLLKTSYDFTCFAQAFGLI